MLRTNLFEVNTTGRERESDKTFTPHEPVSSIRNIIQREEAGGGFHMKDSFLSR